MSTDDQDSLRKLRSEVATRQCVAFVGAGFSAACGMLLWKPLLGELVARLKSKLKSENAVVHERTHRRHLASQMAFATYAGSCVAAGHLQRAASAIRQATQAEKTWLQDQLSDLYSEEKYTTLAASDKRYKIMKQRLSTLLSIRWTGIVTSNYDTLLERDGSRHFGMICDATQANLGLVLRSAVHRRPFLLYLHGNLKKPESIILAEEDYDELYLARPSIDYFLRALLLRHTVVFLGTQIDDEIVRLKKELTLTYCPRGSGVELHREYVILPNDREGSSRAHYLKSTGGFLPVFYEASSDHANLVKILKSLTSTSGSDVLARDPNDAVNHLLVEFVRKSGRCGYDELLRSLSEAEEHDSDVAEALAYLTTDEVYFRLYYLDAEGYLSYDKSRKTFGLGERSVV